LLVLLFLPQKNQKGKTAKMLLFAHGLIRTNQPEPGLRINCPVWRSSPYFCNSYNALQPHSPPLFWLIFAEAVRLSNNVEEIISIPHNARRPVSGTALDENRQNELARSAGKAIVIFC
jgi:hypothetical protein